MLVSNTLVEFGKGTVGISLDTDEKSNYVFLTTLEKPFDLNTHNHMQTITLSFPADDPTSLDKVINKLTFMRDSFYYTVQE